MSSSEYVALLRRNRALIVVLAVLGILAGVAATFAQRPVYTSVAREVISVRSSPDITQIATGATLADSLASTYAQLADSNSVLQKVIDRLDLKVTAEQLSKQVTTTTSTTDPVIDIAVKDSSASRSAEIANSIASQLGSSGSIVAPISATSPVRVTSIQTAMAPESPSSPILLFDIAAGLIAGLAAAAVVIALREVRVRPVLTVERLLRIVPAPVLGRIPADSRDASRRGGFERRSQRWAEAFRFLRTNVDVLDLGERRVIAVGGADPGEGATVVAMNLAFALAEAGESVALVDTNLRAPRMPAMLGLEDAVGVIDVLRGDVSVENALQATDSGIAVMLAGRSVPGRTAAVVREARLRELFDELSERYSAVIVDTGPLTRQAEAAVVARCTSGVLLVASIGRARRKSLALVLERLDQVGARVIGTVANHVGRDGGDAPERVAGAVPAAPARPVLDLATEH